MKFKSTLVALATFVFASSVNATVTYDEDGVGFVGKGDIQSVFDWNNSELQAHADGLQFRLIALGSVTWVCYWETGPDGNITKHTQSKGETFGIDAPVTLDPRANKKGVVTGFNLLGINAVQANEIEDVDFESDPDLTDENVVLKLCPGKGVNKQVLDYKKEGSTEPLLQVKYVPVPGSSLSSETDWFDLPITE